MIFASFYRLDLGITVGLQGLKGRASPKRFYQVHHPLVDYTGVGYRDLTGSEFWHMCTAFGYDHHDRVREISLEGTCSNSSNSLK